jgi:AbrB family looped-hinge helix DNA binding protein
LLRDAILRLLVRLAYGETRLELTRLSSRGQVVLPKPVRRQLGLVQGQRLAVEVEHDRIVLRPVADGGEAGSQSRDQLDGGWRSLRGCLRGADVLGQLLEEHRQEVNRGR